MKILNVLLFLMFAGPAHGDTQSSFDKVRYHGGSIPSKISPDEIRNKLTIRTDGINLDLKNGQVIQFPTNQITSLSYGQEAHHRLGPGIAIGLVSPLLGAMVALHKAKQHLIGIDFTDDQGQKQGILLQGDKSNYQSILVSLQAVTGLPVYVTEKEQSAIAGVRTTAIAEPSHQTLAAVAAPPSPGETAGANPPAQLPDSTNSLWLTSNPDGAEVYLDGSLVSNTPAALKLKPGKHTIRVRKPGYADWSRKIVSQPGFELRLTATLAMKKS